MDQLLAARQRFADEGLDASKWGKEGDRLSNRWLMDRISQLRPADAVLSEESPDDRSRLAARRVWIIDPLDGTREFGEPGRTDWAVHVALSVDGVPAVGAVALPDRSVRATGPTATRNLTTCAAPLRMVVSRTRAPDLCAAVAANIGATLVPAGSAGAKVAMVLDGKAEVYLHAGGMRQWDSCAPVAAALAAGLHASRIDGSPLRYNAESIDVPDLLVCRPETAGLVLNAIASEMLSAPSTAGSTAT